MGVLNGSRWTASIRVFLIIVFHFASTSLGQRRPAVGLVQQQQQDHQPPAAENQQREQQRDQQQLLDIRFNKLPPSAGSTYNLSAILPLSMADYPLSNETANVLKHETMGDSIMVLGDYELYGAEPGEFIDRVGGYPSMPVEKNDPEQHDKFWEDFRHVVDVQIYRRLGLHPSEFSRWPDLWKDYDIHEVAEAVHTDYPGSNQASVLEWMFSRGNVEIDYEVAPFRSNLDIVGKQFRLAYLNTWAVAQVAATSFCMKWHVGRPRPEEIAWKIAAGELTAADDGVPQDLVDKIVAMRLSGPFDFTAYPEGSPNHPSWPAMHSAASSASLWLSVILNLTPEQRCELLRMDYATSYGRTVAGVHYPEDNIAGLNLGKEILLDRFADHMAEMYGSDRNRVQSKLERLSFDWADFDPRDCSVAGHPEYPPYVSPRERVHKVANKLAETIRYYDP